MSIRRVAIIFDHKIRPDTTGVYCRRALGKLVDVEHFLPSELSRIPRSQFDLYLNIDDGLRYELPAELRPCAFWAIDTHLDLPWYLTKSPHFDFVFTAQRDGAMQLRQSGIATASWLPLACDPEMHRKHDVPKQFDVCFVGNLFDGPRTELLDRIRRRFANTFVGQKYFDEMAQAYSASRVVFNRSIENDINMRVFEALACGSLLLTNDLAANGQAELFHDAVHLATYGDADELLDKVAYYLKHEDERERIAAAGRQEVLARHTYRHRMERVLTEVERALETCSLTVPATVPAQKPNTADFKSCNQHIIDLIPISARRILQLDSDLDSVVEALKARQSVHVVPIRQANAIADLPADFDLALCGDALERVTAPLQLLRRLRLCLKPDGRLFADFSNVRYHSVLRALIQGNWTYDGNGTLNESHVRCFTRREIEKLFSRAGFVIDDWQAIPGLGHDESERNRHQGTVSLGPLQIEGLRRDDAEEFYIRRFVVGAVPDAHQDYGLTSIVIITHNQLEYTRRCVESIERLTDEPFEFIFVDNHSTDGTVEYLRSLGEAPSPRPCPLGGRGGVKVILNDQNEGFPKAANQGIQAAHGRQVLLLNNDTVVTTGWLRRMLHALHSDQAIGLVGPCSTSSPGATIFPPPGTSR